MFISPEAKAPDLALNNLDLIDEAGTPNPHATEDNFFDECAADVTLEEQFADATPEELFELSSEAFYDGLNKYQKGIKHYKPAPATASNGVVDPNRLVESSLRYVTWRVRNRHLQSSNELSAMDRVQNGNMYLIEAAHKYDPASKAPFIGMLKPLFDTQLLRPERGGIGLKEDSLTVAQGDLIRQPHGLATYYRAKEFHRGLNFRFGRQLEPEELIPLSSFDEEEIEDYKAITPEYVPFDEIVAAELETGEAYSPAFIDLDPEANPSLAVEERAPHDGITQILNLVSETQSEVVVAKAGLHGADAATLSEVVFKVDLEDRPQVQQAYNSALKKFKVIPARELMQIINGFVRLPEDVVTNASTNGNGSHLVPREALAA